MIISKHKHTCLKKHAFQDIRYKGGRVMNETNKGIKGEQVARCTVCGLEDKIQGYKGE